MNKSNFMRNRLKKRENQITLILFIITMIIACSPLISRYCINGHDLDYHLLRIESLKEGILIGHPFSKVNTLFFGGAGYASSMFYSDLFMHIPALLRVLGVSIGKSFHIYTAMIFVLCYLSTFYCVWKMSLSKFAGSVAAMLLTLCPYHMDDMVVRTACGENAAFIFLPFAIYGIFNVLYEEMDKPWVFGLGFAGLIVTHPATFAVMVGTGVVMLLINVRKLIRQPSVFIKMCIVTVLALLVTSYQWMPMLEQFSNAQFYVSNNWTDLLDKSVGFTEIAGSDFPCVGAVLLGLLVPRIFISRKDYPILEYVDLMIAAALVLAVAATNIMPWERVGWMFGFLQFPWRFFIMTSTLLAMADAIIIKLFINRIGEDKRGIAKELVMTVLLVVTAQSAITHHNKGSMGYYDYSDDYYSYKPFTVNVIAGEWLPLTVEDHERLVDQSEELVFDDGTRGDFERKGGKVIATIDGDHEYADVPFLYYKGYGATITDSKGDKTKLEVTGEGDNGLCRVYLNGAEGVLTVNYKGTIIQYISAIISIVFMLLIFDIWYLRNKYKKKLKLRAVAAGANLGRIACILVFALCASNLCACSTINIQNVTQSSGYSDPDAVIDYLKDKNGDEDSEDEIDSKSLVNVHFSQKGYDKDGKSYAVLVDESTGEQVIRAISLEEAAGIMEEEIPVTAGLYDELLREDVQKVLANYRTDSLKDRIICETDALLCMEVFPDKADRFGITELSGQLADDIVNIPENNISDILEKYDYAAVLAKAAYILEDWESADIAKEKAERFFKEAETGQADEGEPVAARLWAAAELYRLTGQKTYRSVVDAIAMDVVPEGFTFEEPGYFGLFAYLMAPYPTNYNVCTNMMNEVFLEANELIKIPIDEEFADTRIDDKTMANDEKTAMRMLEEAFLVTMTDYVSVSVEYKGFVQNRLNYIYGANLSGIDFTGEDQSLCDFPKLFVLTGLVKEGV